jgi:hypothetical protein
VPLAHASVLTGAGAPKGVTSCGQTVREGAGAGCVNNEWKGWLGPGRAPVRGPGCGALLAVEGAAPRGEGQRGLGQHDQRLQAHVAP